MCHPERSWESSLLPTQSKACPERSRRGPAVCSGSLKSDLLLTGQQGTCRYGLAVCPSHDKAGCGTSSSNALPLRIWRTAAPLQRISCMRRIMGFESSFDRLIARAGSIPHPGAEWACLRECARQTTPDTPRQRPNSFNVYILQMTPLESIFYSEALTLNI
jgi:hypothetical protein